MSALIEDEDYLSDPEYDSNDEHNDFKRRKVIKLAFTKAYAPDWGERDAFRELYQNWFGSHYLLW